MHFSWITAVGCIFVTTPPSHRVGACDVVPLTFPSGFMLGTATASYQIEGAWNASDKGENVWDYWTHNSPENIADGSNGDVACNSYYKYEEDVAWIKSLGFDFYRFSLSWSRILPTGFSNKVSEDGIAYYKNLTTALLANGITPMVTIYHWDHPQIIEEFGGWTNELIVDWFVNYARVIFEQLGPSVKLFATMNEPQVFCHEGYAEGTKAPGKNITGIGPYLCMHNVLKAHAKTWHMYDEEFRETQQGSVGIVLSCNCGISTNSSDTVSSETIFQFYCGWLAHPIWIGDYPEIMKTRIGNISAIQGYPRSRLPTFSDEWISYIRGTADHLGLNHYTSRLVSPDPEDDLENGVFNSDSGLIQTVDPDWSAAASSWFYVVPTGFGHVLRKLRDEYDNPLVYVTENGYSDTGSTDDYNRISYYYEYLRELLIAVKRDNCNVVGYATWSLIDNFEWHTGYTEKFGIISVDFDADERTRAEKLSTNWWKKVVSTRKLQAVPTSTSTSSSSSFVLPWAKL